MLPRRGYIVRMVHAPRPVPLHWKIIFGLVLGTAVGMALNRLWGPEQWAAAGIVDPAAYLARTTPKAGVPDPNAGATPLAAACRLAIELNGFVGDLFVRLLRFIAVPIVLFSIVAGVAGLGDVRALGRLGGRTLVIYLATTVLAVVLGLTLGNVVRPGECAGRPAATSVGQAASAVERAAETGGWWRQMLDLVPANPFEALARGQMLQVIVFALILGAGLGLLPKSAAQPALDAAGALRDAIIRIVHGILRLAPVAVFALMARLAASLGLDVLAGAAAYAGTVLAGLAVILLLEYPLLLRTLGRFSVRDFFRAIAPAQALAFSTSSSVATLPVTIECTTRSLRVPAPIAGFVCSTGATINMDGTALHQAVAALFVAQMHAIDLTLWQQATVLLTAVLASIGAPGIPGGGIVMLVIVLEQVGLPPEAIAGGVAVVLAVDRPLDMCRTVVNVSGDAMTAVLVSRLTGPDHSPAPAAGAAQAGSEPTDTPGAPTRHPASNAAAGESRPPTGLG